jgi:Domain of unknown function (DUF5916)/Carbohydrate family 9 binding domain-like
MQKKFYLFFTIFLTINFYSQVTDSKSDEFIKKKIATKRISNSISIDGKLDETDWQNAEIAKDFVMFDPDNGKPEHSEQKTEVKVVYDDNSVYIGALLYDSDPNLIMKEITERDDFGASDFFGVFINGFNDGQQEYSFFVSAANGQADCVRTTQEGEDFSWDAIWLSKSTITEKGWVVEMKIPLAALRFSKEEKQTWGIQFFREIRRFRQKFTWNHVNNEKGSFTQQAGILEGIENIDTPTRLFFLPYSSFYLNSPVNQKAKGTLKGGLDIKYGLTDAFTLDAVLIPDFGQAKFDNQILNLGPFEQQFNENRAFFTEGTDLFNKGNLFYSRRIGGRPSIGYGELQSALTPNFEITDYTDNISLLNAIKISGRTKNGLGIGFLNAVTEKATATIRDTNSGEKFSKEIEPITNYNVFVLDQRFNQNSSVSFVNTNVIRDGIFQDANVSAVVFDLNTKENTWNLGGDVKYSYINAFGNNENKEGVNSALYLGETSGKIRFNLNGRIVSKDFDNNDLGINFITNYYSFGGNINLRSLKSTNTLNSYRVNFNTFQQFNLQTGYLQEQNFNINTNITTKKNHSAGLGLNLNPFKRYNYYDTRVEGKAVIYPKNYNMWMYISTNYNNKFAIDTNPFIGFAEAKGWWFYYFDLSPRYRFSDKLLVVFRNSYNKEFNDLGWVAQEGNEIVFAKRDRVTYESGIDSKYSITSNMNFGLNIRYYWSYAENKSFYNLQDNGYVKPYNFNQNVNSDFKSWNTDLSFSWWFAPGSQMTVLYRNNAGNFSNQINKKFIQNLDSVLNQNSLNHIFSISIKYFIDFNQAKNWL